MDDLIHRKATGTPLEFAVKMGICRSQLMQEIKELRDMEGWPIKYDNIRRSYYYEENGRVIIEFREQL